MIIIEILVRSSLFITSRPITFSNSIATNSDLPLELYILETHNGKLIYFCTYLNAIRLIIESNSFVYLSCPSLCPDK